MTLRHIIHTVIVGALLTTGYLALGPGAICKSANDEPDPKCQPGAVRTTDRNVICLQKTGDIRPPASYTTKLKIQQIKEYGYKDTNTQDYEEDHIISLELGGDPTDPKNLWPEPYQGQYGAKVKDTVENYLHKQICNGAMSVQDAQKGISTNWKQYLNAQ